MAARFGAAPGCKVYVGGVDAQVQESEMYDIFSRAGQVVKVWIARNPPGFAFVEFGDARDAEQATRTLDGTEIRGKVVRVEISNKPARTDRGGGGGGGGGGDEPGRGGRAEYGSRPPVTCYICHTPGHIAAFCPSNAPPSSRHEAYPPSSYPPPPGAYPGGGSGQTPRGYRGGRSRSRSPRGRHSHRHRSGSRSRSASPRYRSDRDRRDGDRDGRDRGREPDRVDRRPPVDERRERDDRRPPADNGRDRRRDEGSYRGGGGDSRGDRGGYRGDPDRPREPDGGAPPPPPQADDRDPTDLGDLDAQP